MTALASAGLGWLEAVHQPATFILATAAMGLAVFGFVLQVRRRHDAQRQHHYGNDSPLPHELAREQARDAVIAAARALLAALRVPGPMPATVDGKQALMAAGFAQIDAAAERLRVALDALDH